MPFRDLRPDGAGIDVEGKERQRRLRQVGDGVGDGQVASKAQAVDDGGQQRQAEQGNPGGRTVVPSPAEDESQAENDDDGAVGRERRPFGPDRESERDTGEHDHPSPSRDRVGVEVQVE